MNKKVYTEIFCKNVKYLREKNNLSGTKMSKKLGITIKSLDMIESGKLPPRLSVHILDLIEESFGIPNKDMFTLLEKK